MIAGGRLAFGIGCWGLRDQELSFDGVKARVIKVNGAYLVPSFPEDPDVWDGRPGFARKVAK